MANKKDFKYNDISFNKEWALSISEADFVKEFTKGRPAEGMDDKQKANFAKFKQPYDLSEVQLKEAYQFMKADGNDQKSGTESAAVQTAGAGKSSNIGNKGTDPKL